MAKQNRVSKSDCRNRGNSSTIQCRTGGGVIHSNVIKVVIKDYEWSSSVIKDKEQLVEIVKEDHVTQGGGTMKSFSVKGLLSCCSDSKTISRDGPRQPA